MNLIDRLTEISDQEYALFQAKLTPSVDKNLFIGVRVPILREFAKKFNNEDEHITFLNSLPHKYYDENMLHGLLIEKIKDYDLCIKRINEFLPYVDNWAVCDIMSPKILKKHLDKLINEINKWLDSDKTYTIRFGIEMFMSYYLDIKDYDLKPIYDKINKVKDDDYYTKMMIAWFYSTALSKRYEETIYILENRLLDRWTHNKTIQKCKESRRISDDIKTYLETLKY